MRATRVHLALPAVFLAAVSLAGCSGSDSTKAGGAEPPVTLRIGTDDVPGRPAADSIEEFARQVKELSDDKLRIEPVWDADGPGHVAWDQRVARMVVGGELAMGLIPARAWDTEGVTSLRALHAPFLVTSDELLDRIVTSELADDMLKGLEEAGVVGLALVPESLRHPFAYGAPLISRASYRDARIRTPRSEVGYALFRALGGKPDDLIGDPFTAAVANGSYAGAESSFAFADALQAPTTATTNVTFFPKANALVINAGKLDDLSDAEREILEEAARRTQRWTIEATPTDAEAAASYCALGGRAVLADPSQIAELEQAAAPVYAELERDPETRSLIESIRAMKRDVPAAGTSSTCGRPRDGAAPVPTTRPAPTAIDGVYRAELTEDELLARGMSPVDARGNQGLVRLTFSGGELVMSEERGGWPDCHATYRVSGAELQIHVTGPGCPREERPMRTRWTLDDRKLRIAPIEPNDPSTRAWWGSEPWTRIAAVRTRMVGIPNGVYRTSLTQDDLVQAGLDAGQAPTFDGLHTFTLRDGTIVDKLAGDGPVPGCIGSYSVSGTSVEIRWTKQLRRRPDRDVVVRRPCLAVNGGPRAAAGRDAGRPRGLRDEAVREDPMSGRRRATIAPGGIAVLLLAGAIATGCSGSESTKAGGTGPPVTLRIGTNDTPGRPGSDQIEEFARQVKELSGGRDADRAGMAGSRPGAGLGSAGRSHGRLGRPGHGVDPLARLGHRGRGEPRALTAPFLVTSRRAASPRRRGRARGRAAGRARGRRCRRAGADS